MCVCACMCISVRFAIISLPSLSDFRCRKTDSNTFRAKYTKQINVRQ